MEGLYNIAILGATGIVGQNLCFLLEERKFPVKSLKLLASPKSQGKKFLFKGEAIQVETASKGCFNGVDLVFLCAGATCSKEYFEELKSSNAFAIDLSSAYRMDPEIPLVIPEVNFSEIKKNHRYIAKPNCCAAILLTAIAPLRNLGHFNRILVNTYQSVSGGGVKAVTTLLQETEQYLLKQKEGSSIDKKSTAFNLQSHPSAMREDGSNEEEYKIMCECRKILGQPDLKMSTTCIRVPVLRSHSLSVNLEFKDSAPQLQDAKKVLESAPGVKVVDDPENGIFPTPLLSDRQNEILVGRIRKDPSHPNGINLFICGDQLYKGAALNAIQIAEKLHQENRIFAAEALCSS